MADIIAVVDDPTQSVITATTSTGGTTIITNSNLTNVDGISLSSMSSIGNVDTTTLNNGALLVYKTNTNKWTSTTSLDSQNMEGGEF
jgi:hypothetical protein